MKRTFFSTAVSAVLLFPAAGCFPLQNQSKSASPMAPSGGVQPQDLTPQEWVTMSKPSPSHELLDMFVGNWKTSITFWSSPNAAPESSSGTSATSWILGRRFIEEKFTGNALGEAFQGIGIMGYDNGARRFTNVWMDSLNTAMSTAYGKYFAEQNRFEFVGEIYDPTLGAMKKTRSSIDVLSADAYLFTMYDKTSNGEEFKSLEIRYQRG